MARSSVTAVLFVLATFALSAVAGIDDMDNDGVTDETDNCVLVANPLQRDTDADDIGNFCDPDLNNDGLVTSADRTILNEVFFTSDADSDFNADGNVNFLDLAILQSYFGQPPGPPGIVIWAVAANGSWHDKSNWLPPVVPSAGVTAIVDVAGNIVVSVDGDTASVKTLILEEDLELNDATFSASNQVEASGTITMTGSVINNTTIVPSQAGSGLLATGAGSANQLNGVTLGIDGLIANGDLVQVTGGLTVNATITIVGPTSPTGLQFTETQTLNGSGEVVINGSGNSVITEPRLFPLNGTTLTIGPNLTISGGNGTIGQTFASLVLDGNVAADVSSETLVISGAPWSGTGTLSAASGATIRLIGQLDNSGNAMAFDTAAGSLEIPAGTSLINATLNGTPGSNLSLGAGSYTFQDLVLNTDVTMNNGAIANVPGGLTINNSLTIKAPTSPTGLQFTQTQTFNGSGSVIFNGTGNGVISEPRLFPVNGTTLTIGPNLTISGGTGTIGQTFASLVLNGNVTADASSETLVVSGAPWSATGTLTAENGAMIQLSGELDNGTNAVDLDAAAGTVTLLNGAGLANATLNGTPGTVITLNSGSYDIEAVQLDVDMNMNNGAIANVSGGLTLNGSLAINAPSSPTGLHFTETQTFDGSGSVIFNGIGNGVISEPRLFPVNGTTLTIGPNLTISGGTGTIGQTFASLVLDGNVTADASSETLVVSGAPWSATGTLTAENGAMIQLSGELDNGTNAVDLDAAAGTVTLLNGAGLANATLNGTPGTVITLNSGSYDIEAVQLDVNMNMNNGAIANVSGGLTLNGSLAINAPSSPTGLHFTETQTFDGSGSVIFNGIGNGVISEPRLFPVNGTTLTIGPNLSISGGIGTVGNFSAALILNGTVSASTANLQVLGSTVTNGGLLEALNGNDLTADNLSGDPGTLHAGADSTVILLDALSLSAGSHVIIDIGGPALVGRLSATSGAAVYDGTATISAVDGFMPSVSDSFVILNHNGFSGSFDTVNSVGLGAGESFSISFDAVEGEATVTD